MYRLLSRIEGETIVTVKCPSCGTVNEATVRNEEENLGKHGKVVLPVWQCNVCDFEWTNGCAGKIRARHILRALNG